MLRHSGRVPPRPSVAREQTPSFELDAPSALIYSQSASGAQVGQQQGSRCKAGAVHATVSRKSTLVTTRPTAFGLAGKGESGVELTL